MEKDYGVDRIGQGYSFRVVGVFKTATGYSLLTIMLYPLKNVDFSGILCPYGEASSFGTEGEKAWNS